MMHTLLACLPCMECVLYPLHVQSLPGGPIAPVMTTIVLGCYLTSAIVMYKCGIHVPIYELLTLSSNYFMITL